MTANPQIPDPAGLLARPALAVQVADVLRGLILEGELKGGEKIRERELTERFGVSRTPLREAMKILASEGLIDLIPNRGAVVARRSDAELADAFPVLAALEGIAGRQAAERASDAEIAEIARLTGALRDAVGAGDRPLYFEINQKIHAAILAASRNEMLARTHATVAGQIHRARYQANLTRSRWEKALAEHERIAEALAARDGAALGTLLHDHMMAKLTAILEARRSGAAG
ncbi:GntR family transcriptional regulator [Limimaricola pyoseonensis]|uniref:DNA-binding transcriptional regulator, GntR family n=1 Tax=Limimaricola pyoseonensis TaxID=521013 RepID=A0A1G7KQI9_9RHOB|nr:GntR family transcriptional regulator [Limimaricola pyoseonensis]SDF39477.1 DNA-binding transcriptional regulator, GntR family [Limimaricola pyoseonensis]